MFFVVSPGRSGSQTVAQVLSQSPTCLCLHEPHPQLVAESARYQYGRFGHDRAVALLRRTRPQGDPDAVYGESNNRLALLLPPLREAFPDACFVWLLRDGRDFVASELQRGGFADPPRRRWTQTKWERWRPRGDEVGDVPAATWASWDPFSRLCWQWAWVNRRIGADLADLGPDRLRRVRIEELAGDLPELCRWLGLEPVDFVVPRANRRRDAGDPGGADRALPNNVPRVESWDGWDDGRRAVFEDRCGDVMDEHYPGWRKGGSWQPTPVEAGEPAAPADGVQAELARARAQNAELRVSLAEAASAHRELVGSAPLLAKHLAIRAVRAARELRPGGRAGRQR